MSNLSEPIVKAEPVANATLRKPPIVGLSMALGPMVGVILALAIKWTLDGPPSFLNKDEGLVMAFAKIAGVMALFAYPAGVIPAGLSAYLCLRFGAATPDGQVRYGRTMGIAFAVCFVFCALAMQVLEWVETKNGPRWGWDLSVGAFFFGAFGALCAEICAFIAQKLRIGQQAA